MVSFLEKNAIKLGFPFLGPMGVKFFSIILLPEASIGLQIEIPIFGSNGASFLADNCYQTPLFVFKLGFPFLGPIGRVF